MTKREKKIKIEIKIKINTKKKMNIKIHTKIETKIKAKMKIKIKTKMKTKIKIKKKIKIKTKIKTKIHKICQSSKRRDKIGQRTRKDHKKTEKFVRFKKKQKLDKMMKRRIYFNYFKK